MFKWAGIIAACLSLWLLVVPAEVQAAASIPAARKLMDQGHEREAVGMLQQIVRESDGEYQAWFLLGVAYARQHQYHEAIEAFRKVSELRPDLAEPHNNLAVIYNELGDLRAAVSELEVSLAKNPDYATAQENLGDLYVKLALQAYQRSLVQAPSPALKARYDRLLQVRIQTPSAQVDDAKGDVRKPMPAPVVASTDADTGVIANPKPVAESQAAAMDQKTADAQPPAEEVVADTKPLAVSPATAIQGEEKPVRDVQKEMQAADPAAPVLDAIEAWRQAWSERNVAAYLDAYGKAFVPGGRFASRAEWEQYKQRVIEGKSFIRVKLDHIRVNLVDAQTAKVRFDQHFRSNNYDSDDRKELTLRQSGDGWKITDEKSL